MFSSINPKKGEEQLLIYLYIIVCEAKTGTASAFTWFPSPLKHSAGLLGPFLTMKLAINHVILSRSSSTMSS